mmetsp:Transcript_18343/g.29479  ORF Transcript_18343/g.29479 Transcript_18343/m.29479 type:complete len:284 (+) Transcript_18343:9254-10105(+)
MTAAKRPVVGVTANHLVDDGVHRNWLRFKYVEALRTQANVDVLVLPTQPELACGYLNCLARLDGLVLTGDESNIDADALRNKQVDRPDYVPGELDLARDRLSGAALETALHMEMPILGICRGLQEMNVFFGGTLHQDLGGVDGFQTHTEDLSLPRDRQYDPVHEVTLTPGGWLRGILDRDKIKTNSLHGQGIDQLGSGLGVEATSSDGLIEAVSVIGSPVLQLGVQWHPEWHAGSTPVSQAIFELFGQQCENFRCNRAPEAMTSAFTAKSGSHLRPLGTTDVR